MAERIYKCGRLVDIFLRADLESGNKTAILNNIKELQDRCAHYGACTLIPGTCAVQNLKNILESGPPDPLTLA